jgi:hypothetical protein
MAKKLTEQKKVIVPHKKRTSIGSGTPLNKSKRRQWKPYRGQGRG